MLPRIRRALEFLCVSLPATGLFAPGAAAQGIPAPSHSPWSVEARGGVTFPVGDFSDGLSSGIGVELTGRYALNSLVQFYGGVARASFEAELNRGDFLGGELLSTVVTSGFDAGVVLHFPGRNVDPWIRTGAIFHRLAFDLTYPGTDRIRYRSQRQVGVTGGAGLDVPLTGRIRISPSVHVQGYGPDLQDDRIGRTPNVGFVLLDFGVRYVF